jgi:glycosyltransferase involved in cell wall biosynthesis
MARSAFLLVGKVGPTIEQAVKQRINELRARWSTNLWLHLVDAFVADTTLHEYVRRAQVLLAPYRKFVGSSGMLIWAWRYGKPLISQGEGYVGWVVRHYGLGTPVNTADPASIAAAISDYALGHRPIEVSQAATSFGEDYLQEDFGRAFWEGLQTQARAVASSTGS